MKGIRIGELTYEQVPTALETHPVVVLPIGGGSKEHGPHLPLGTDFWLAEGLAERVVEQAPVLLLPTLAYAYYPAFVDWAGSISIRSRVFMDLVGDIVRSMHRHGARRFLLLDTGVSTHPPLKTLSSELHEELGVMVAVTDITKLGAEVAAEIEEQSSGGHADEMETSYMLVLKPELVQMDRAPREWRKGIPGAVGPSGVLKVHVGGKMRTQHGINGDATLATREKGEAALAAMAADVVTFIESFAKTPLPEDRSR
jgi:creatinine amidohydrolase